MNVYYFEPSFIFYLVIALLLLYPILLIVGIVTIKVNILGKILFVISAILYGYIIWYSYQFGVYSDELEYNSSRETEIFGNIGYFHLILLTFPYIFLSMGFGFRRAFNN